VQGVKLQDVKMTDQMTRRENAGHEIAGQEPDMKLTQKRQTFEAECIE